MNKTLIFILIIISTQALTQELELFYGQNYTYENRINTAINQRLPNIDNAILWTPMLGFPISKKQKIYFSFDSYSIWNGISLKIDEEYEPGLPTGFGTSITRLRRLGIGYQHLLTKPIKKFKASIRSFLFIGKRKKNTQYVTRLPGVPFYSPSIFHITAFDKVTIIPSLGFKLSYTFLKRFNALFWANKYVGFTVLQEGRWEHSYMEVVQPDAITQNKGSGFYISIGLGYNFKKK